MEFIDATDIVDASATQIYQDMLKLGWPPEWALSIIKCASDLVPDSVDDRTHLMTYVTNRVSEAVAEVINDLKKDYNEERKAQDEVAG